MISILVWDIKNQNRINSSDFVDHGLAPTAGLLRLSSSRSGK